MSDQRRRDEALETSASRLRAILDTALCGIVTLDELGTILTINAAGERLLGYSASELVGRDVTRLMGPPWRDEHSTYIERYVRTGERRIIGTGREVSARHRDGHEVPVYLAVSEFVADGQRFFTGILHDLTERKRAEAELRRQIEQQAVVADLGVRAISGVELSELEAEAVRLVAETLGVEYAKLLELQPDSQDCRLVAGYGWPPEALGSRISAKIDSQAGYTLESRVPVIVEDLAREKRFSGPPLLIENGVSSGLSVVVLGDDRPWGVLGVHSKRRRQFNENDVNFLQSVANVLAEAIQQHRTQRRLLEQEALAQLGEMAAIVAHEVKNTQAGVAGALRIVAARTPVDSETRPVVDEMIERIEKLSAFMVDVLAFARPRMPDVSNVPIMLLLEDTVTLLREHPDCTRVRLSLHGDDVTVPCDPEMLRPVIVNLIVNAAQAREEPGSVEIRVEEVHGEEGELARITVTDDGPGVPEDVLPRVFQPFFSTKHRGSGLGLAIAKRIVELHGGEISLENAERGGARAVVRLPLVHRPAGSRPAS